MASAHLTEEYNSQESLEEYWVVINGYELMVEEWRCWSYEVGNFHAYEVHLYKDGDYIPLVELEPEGHYVEYYNEPPTLLELKSLLEDYLEDENDDE